MWEDYYEPSEFDILMDGFKDSIRENVKQEIKEKIERLEKENAELRDVKEKWEDVKRYHEEAICELKREKERVRKELESKKINELLESLAFMAYRPLANTEVGPKCDKCDENRRIYFTSPMGRKMSEDCICAARKVTYAPSEEALFRFYVRSSGQVSTRYFTRKEDGDWDSYDYCGTVYSELPDDLEKITPFRAVFMNLSDCEKYCDYLNNKKGRLRRKDEGYLT